MNSRFPQHLLAALWLEESRLASLIEAADKRREPDAGLREAILRIEASLAELADRCTARAS